MILFIKLSRTFVINHNKIFYASEIISDRLLSWIDIYNRVSSTSSTSIN